VQSGDAGSDHPGDAALPTVLVEDASLEEPASISQVVERELAPERRRGPRVPLQRPVRLSDGERFVTGQIVNLSASGLLIRSPALLPARTAIAGAFLPDALSDPEQVVGFRGRVVRLEQGCVGVQLTRMTWAHRLELAALIDRRQREPRRDPTLRGWKAGG
jgi:hypothetical protein